MFTKDFENRIIKKILKIQWENDADFILFEYVIQPVQYIIESVQEFIPFMEQYAIQNGYMDEKKAKCLVYFRQELHDI